MYVTYTRIYGWSDYGGESSYQPGYRLENMMWMTLLVYDYIIPGENHCYKVLTDYFHLLREWEKKYAPKQPDEEWNPLFAEALYKKNYIEYLLDILLYGSLEERKALVAEQRKEVLKLEQ